jgi:DNA repair exonuclease SbcCD nuclease subunit
VKLTKPIAVLISDIHYNLQTLPVADAALKMAVQTANDLNVPLIVAGDLHDTKANIRAECLNAMLDTFAGAKIRPLVIVGNHDAINEKSDKHSLNGLTSAVTIVDREFCFGPNMYLLPYYSNPEALKAHLMTVPKGSTIIMHQGIQGSNSGEYIQDKSAISKEDVKDFRVISGHYHARQDIKTGRPQKGGVGLFSYIGNPYTLNFGESKDPIKGYQVLMSDGMLEFVPTGLRKHIVVNLDLGLSILTYPDVSPEDIVLVKLAGSKEDLRLLSKEDIAKKLHISTNFRLDKLPYDTVTESPSASLSQEGLLDSLIDSLTNTTKEQKLRLQELWKGL